MSHHKIPKISHSQLTDTLKYAPSTGVFIWKKPRRGMLAGTIAGTPKDGYMRIRIGGESFYSHRLAWFYVHGVWPSELDHKNGIPNDNRIANLRKATPRQNCHNRRIRSDNKCGQKGVCKKGRKWYARIYVSGKEINLGAFDNIVTAGKAYAVAAKKHFGPFWRTA